MGSQKYMVHSEAPRKTTISNNFLPNLLMAMGVIRRAQLWE